MNISTTDAQGLFTKKLIDTYKERVPKTSFLRSFFPTGPGDVTDTLELSIEVQRGSEKVAVDVLRGSDGNRNEFSRSTEKIWIPPYFREYFDQNHMQVYDRLFRASEISDSQFANLINSIADHVQDLQDKIDRKYEIFMSNILETGIMLFDQGVGQIDFKRKASSLVDLSGAGGYWTVDATDVFAQFQAAGTFLRKFGKTGTFTFNVILGETAVAALFNNATFKGRQNLFNLKLDNVLPPQANAIGGVFLGTVIGGPYTFNLWTYPQYYEDQTTGVLTPYVPAKKVFVIPQSPKFRMAFAATPQLLNPGQAPITGPFIISEYTDQKARTREFHVESAGMPIPTAIDQIYTMQAVA